MSPIRRQVQKPRSAPRYTSAWSCPRKKTKAQMFLGRRKKRKRAEGEREGGELGNFFWKQTPTLTYTSDRY